MFSILPAFVAFYFLCVGFFVLFQNKRTLLAKIFFVLCIFTFAWQISWSFLFQIQDLDIAVLIAKFGWAFILFIPTTLYHFLSVLSESKKDLKLVFYSYLLSIILLTCLLFSDQFIAGVYHYYWGFYPKAGIIHPIHVLQTSVVVMRGLYITYQKQKHTFVYKNKSQLIYCAASLLIYMFAAVDYLCNYGLEFYPPGIIFITISLTIISYAIIKHRLLDLNSALSHILSRLIIYSIFLVLFVFIHILLTGSYLPENKIYILGVLFVTIVICEIYGYLIIRVGGISDSVLNNEKIKNKKIINELSLALENAITIDQLFIAISEFIKSNLNAKLIGFYVKKQVYHKQANSNEYIEVSSERSHSTTFDPSFIEQVSSSRSVLERDHRLIKFLNGSEDNIIIPLMNSSELIGFIAISANESLKFWHYQIFDSWVSNIGIIIDRIFAYKKISEQEKKFLEEKANSLKSLAASIAHEIRNPLNSINLVKEEIADLIQSDSAKLSDPKFLKQELSDLNTNVSDAIDTANGIINLILSDLSEKPVLQSEFAYLKPEEVLPQIIKKFGYKSESEKLKVNLDLTLKPSSADSNSNSALTANSNSFIFRAVPQRFDFIMYNLMKNALYYLDQYPNSIVTIGLEERHKDGKDYNVIYVHDSGPGIPESIIPKLFGDFFTAGKKGGTGLGLAFCKRNMRLFGGEIFCESYVANAEASEEESNAENLSKNNSSWTKFSLLFPKLSEAELMEANAQFAEDNAQTNLNAQGSTQGSIQSVNQGANQSATRLNATITPKRILIVDDERINLVVTKSKIEKCLPGISCDTALGGDKAIEMFESVYKSKNSSGNNLINKPYDLILMDIQMPEMDGITTTKKIREFIAKNPKKEERREEGRDASKNSIGLVAELTAELPIIALTSLDHKTFTIKANQIGSNFSAYINKSSSNNVLCRSVAKWLFDYSDGFCYLSNQEEGLKNPSEILSTLKNKEVLLADDQEMNRKLTKRMLEKYGMKVTESSNGGELLKLYQESLVDNKNPLTSQTKSSKFNIILTDINMPIMSGDEATIKIRDIEDANFTKHQNRIPVIAISGDGSKEDITKFLQAEMTDYFIKGTNNDTFINIIANYTKEDEAKKEAICEDNVDISEKLSTQTQGQTDQAQNQMQNNQQNQIDAQQDQDLLNLIIFNPSKIDFLGTEEKKEIINLYLDDSSKIMAKITQNHEDKNLLQASFNVHALKGTSSNIGSEKLVAFIRTIEPALKHNQPPQNQNWFLDLKSFYNEFVEELRKNIG